MNQKITLAQKNILPSLRQAAEDALKPALAIFVIAVFCLAFAFSKTPSTADLAAMNISQTTIIYDRTGQHVLYELHGEENRKIITHGEIPDSMRAATIATEDDAFYSHKGIDFLSVARAMKTNIERRSMEQGGSTITQQLARNVFLSREKTLKRKISEAALAIKIERQYSKDEILDMYLNVVPYGSNAYGIEAAAETFFGKKASNLTLDEAALLAALPKATTYYSPYGNRSDELVFRQKKILKRIANLNLASYETVAEALKADTLGKVIPLKQKIEAPHFVFYVKDELEKKFGPEILRRGGMKVYTTLDYEMQKTAERIVSETAEYNLKRYGASNAALVAIDPKNGEILSMVGSKDYFNKEIDGEVNVAVRPRQPGSSFKPFAYARAFEEGYQPETLLLDAKTNFGPDGSGRPYVPRNYDGKFHGIVSMREALAMSLNVPAIKTLQLVGIDDTIELAHRLGITTLNDRNRYGLSLVIGGGEVTLLDETSGFSVFANDGQRNPAEAILRIENRNGVVFQNSQPKNIQVLDPQVARKINSVLSDNAARVRIFGPRNLLHIDGRTVAAKTGTTQEWKDGWTVGYTPSLAVGVWVGNNDSRPMKAKADGSYVAAPIWNKFMKEVLQNRPDETFIAYDKIETKTRFADATEYKTVYYKKKNGKKISAEKARKLDPEDVEIKIEAVGTSDKRKLSSVVN